MGQPRSCRASQCCLAQEQAGGVASGSVALLGFSPKQGLPASGQAQAETCQVHKGLNLFRACTVFHAAGLPYRRSSSATSSMILLDSRRDSLGEGRFCSCMLKNGNQRNAAMRACCCPPLCVELIQFAATAFRPCRSCNRPRSARSRTSPLPLLPPSW